MNLLITGAWRDAGRYIEAFEKSGHTVLRMQYETDALPCDPSWPEGVICNSLFLNHDIRDFSSLRYIQLTSAGLDRVPVDDIRERGIVLKNARGVYSVPMAEHAVASVLYFYRKLQAFIRARDQRLWRKERELRELNGKTVCVIGCGSVGTECAKRFGAFGCRVIGVDAETSLREGFDAVYPVGQTIAILPSVDVVLLTLPLTHQTEGFADRAFFDALKDGCVLVNISRGKIVKSDAMIKALTERELYAALDVFDEEPLFEDSPLWQMDNVLLTPHNSYVGEGNSRRLNDLIMRNLTGVLHA